MSSTFSSLQSIRGLFAIFIFLHHLGLFEAGGDSGVAFFIILSGFVMSAGYRDKINSHSITYRHYITKRFRRIYPYHIIGFIVALVFMNPFYGRLTPLIWTANLSMVQSWIPNPTFYFSCDSPSWCLSDLFFCYCMFPFLSPIISSGKNCIILISTVIPIYIAVALILPTHMLNSLLYINPLFRIIDFIIGMILWTIFNSNFFTKIKASLMQLPNMRKSILEGLILISIGVIYFLYPVIPENFALVSYWWMPVILIILLFSSLQEGGIFNVLFQKTWAIKFGNLSFSFYMLHVPIIIGYRKFSILLNQSSDINLTAILIIFFVTLLGSVLCERIVKRIMSLSFN